MIPLLPSKLLGIRYSSLEDGGVAVSRMIGSGRVFWFGCFSVGRFWAHTYRTTQDKGDGKKEFCRFVYYLLTQGWELFLFACAVNWHCVSTYMHYAEHMHSTLCYVAFVSCIDMTCMVDSGSSARATQPFPFVSTTTRCLSLSRSVCCNRGRKPAFSNDAPSWWPVY